MDGSCPHRATGAIVADTSAKAGRMHKNHFDAVARSLSGPQALIPGHGQAYGLGLTQHPTGQAVSAEAGEIHRLDFCTSVRLRKWLTTRRNTAASSSIRVLSSIVVKVLRNTRHKLPRPLGAIPLDQADGIRRLNKRWWQAHHHPAGGCRLWACGVRGVILSECHASSGRHALLKSPAAAPARSTRPSHSYVGPAPGADGGGKW
jgi:hypothetical protein